MPKIALKCFIPAKTENTDENLNTVYSLSVQGKKGPNTATPGPNSDLFANPQTAPNFVLQGLKKEVFDQFVGKTVTVTIESEDEAEK